MISLLCPIAGLFCSLPYSRKVRKTIVPERESVRRPPCTYLKEKKRLIERDMYWTSRQIFPDIGFFMGFVLLTGRLLMGTSPSNFCLHVILSIPTPAPASCLQHIIQLLSPGKLQP